MNEHLKNFISWLEDNILMESELFFDNEGKTTSEDVLTSLLPIVENLSDIRNEEQSIKLNSDQIDNLSELIGYCTDRSEFNYMINLLCENSDDPDIGSKVVNFDDWESIPEEYQNECMGVYASASRLHEFINGN